MKFPSFKSEPKYLEDGLLLLPAATRRGGPLAGPAGRACVLDPKKSANTEQEKWYFRVRDQDRERRRTERLVKEILNHSLAYGWHSLAVKTLTGLIFNSQLCGWLWRKCEVKLGRGKIFILVDGRFKIPGLQIEQRSIVKGDNSVLSIAPQHPLLQKSIGDSIMKNSPREVSEYGFHNHKGYKNQGTCRGAAQIWAKRSS